MPERDENGAKIPIRLYVDRIIDGLKTEIRLIKESTDKDIQGLSDRTKDGFETANRVREQLNQQAIQFYPKESHDLYAKGVDSKIELIKSDSLNQVNALRTEMEGRLKPLETWHDRTAGQIAILVAVFTVITVIAQIVIFYFRP